MSLLRPVALLATAFVALVTLPVAAQQPAAAGPTVAVPVMACEKPGEMPIDRNGPQMTRFAKKVDDYKLCVNDYTKSNGVKASEYAEASRAYSDAANKAIDDYNAYITDLNARSKSGGEAKGASGNVK